ncbi:hypothetical protein AD948_07125 [Acetobacter senegalensis]|uniref:3,4-dihydroxy-2-butanone 4-phosphate synthase n=1 Tax=Acetobacter senegalensis TaxID=446692 RepID=A0A149U3A8_9PROT|nr:3,4-dihydroxy-2-butanone-4-phosphate synthase [Acetobacter senegalensis]KXV59837.1 hypothetical protein AD948_07125 [Acetobacter senegalensis]
MRQFDDFESDIALFSGIRRFWHGVALISAFHLNASFRCLLKLQPAGQLCAAVTGLRATLTARSYGGIGGFASAFCLKPAEVLCEILNEDGTMARRTQLDVFSQRFDLPIISIADILREVVGSQSNAGN